jgi:hypothetical protein
MNGIVQGLWIGGRLPPMQRLSIQSFLDHGHDFHLYVYGDLEDIPAGTTICDGTKILPREQVFQHRQGFGKGSYSTFSNIFRYALIFKRGGWWVDTDLVCLRPFDFAQEYVFATELEDAATLTTTCALKCPKGAALLEYCLHVANSKDPDELKWSEIGPYLFHDAVTRFRLLDHRVEPHVFSPVNAWKFNDVLKPAFEISRLANSHGLHLWNQMWRHEQVDPDQTAHPDSLYVRLKNRHGVQESIS